MKLELIHWYADPITSEIAEKLAYQAAMSRAKSIKQGIVDESVPVNELIASFWIGGQRQGLDKLSVLLKTETSPRLNNALNLIYGQLLISCKLKSALSYLQTGLQGLVPFLSASDYMILLRRHELLSALELKKEANPPATLKALVTEARVIMQLGGKAARLQARSKPDSKDTLG